MKPIKIVSERADWDNIELNWVGFVYFSNEPAKL